MASTQPIVPTQSSSGARWLGATAVLLAIVVGALSPMLLRNQIVALDENVDLRWKQVEVQLQRQHELLPKLVAVTKRYATYESELIREVANVNAKFESAEGSSKPALASSLDVAIGKIVALGDRYPELRADAHFQNLSHEIAGTKNRIAVERARYNAAVKQLNTRLGQFPWQQLTSATPPRDYYEVPATQLEDPVLDL